MDDLWETEMKEFRALVKFTASLQFLLLEELTQRSRWRETANKESHAHTEPFRQAAVGPVKKTDGVTC